MFLSIVIPVYNSEKYIEECIQSCLHQDLPEDEYEIICVDDGSTDNSLKILECMTKKDSRIRILCQPNSGVSVARNNGLKHSKGDWIWFVDSDDTIQSNVLLKLKSTILDDTDLVSFGCFCFVDEMSQTEIEEAKNRSITSNYPSLGLWKNIFRKQTIIENSIYFYPELHYGEDLVFIAQFRAVSRTQENIEEVFYFYRRNIYSTTRNVDKTVWLESHIFGANKLFDLYKCKPSDELASNIMYFMFICMGGISKLRGSERRNNIRKLKQLGLFPMKPFPEIKNHHFYSSTKKNFVARIVNNLTMKSTSRLGFFNLCMWERLYRSYETVLRLCNSR